MASTAARRSKRSRSHASAGVCPECNETLPIHLHLDADDQERAILHHLLKCSATSLPTNASVGASAPLISSPAHPAPLERSSLLATKPIPKSLLGIGGRQLSVPVVASGLLPKCLGAPLASGSKTPGKERRSPDLSNSIQSPDLSSSTQSTALTSQSTNSPVAHTQRTESQRFQEAVSYINGLPSTHLLKQQWWKKPRHSQKQPAKLSGVIPSSFNLQECVEEVENPGVKGLAQRKSKRLRPSASCTVVKFRCPVCKKDFKSLTYPVTEETMSRHVKRCSKNRLHMGATGPKPALTMHEVRKAATRERRHASQFIAVSDTPDIVEEQRRRCDTMKVFRCPEVRRSIRDLLLRGLRDRKRK